MDSRLESALESCIARIRNGETIERCVADYPGLRSELEALLQLSRSLADAETMEASSAFRSESRARVLSRLSRGPRAVGISTPVYRTSLAERLQELRFRLAAGGWNGRRALVPAGALAGVIVMVALVLQPWAASPETGNGCTVTSTSGVVDVLLTDSSQWRDASEGMNIALGERLRTGAYGDSNFVTYDVTLKDAASGAFPAAGVNDSHQHRHNRQR